MEMIPLLGENVTQGLIIGIIIGAVFQLATKAIRLILIIQFVTLKWLEARNIIVIDYHRLTAGLLGKEEFVIQEAQSMLDSLLEIGIFGGALALGFFVGRKITKWYLDAIKSLSIESATRWMADVPGFEPGSPA